MIFYNQSNEAVVISVKVLYRPREYTLISSMEVSEFTFMSSNMDIAIHAVHSKLKYA